MVTNTQVTSVPRIGPMIPMYLVKKRERDRFEIVVMTKLFLASRVLFVAEINQPHKLSIV